MQKKISEILKKASKEFNISQEEAEKIWLSQFLLLKEILNVKDPDVIETIKFPKWGKYYPSKGKIAFKKSMDAIRYKKYLDGKTNKDNSIDSTCDGGYNVDNEKND